MDERLLGEAGIRTPDQRLRVFVSSTLGEYIAQSDAFIGLYWQRYGWVAPGMARSRDQAFLAMEVVENVRQN